MSKAANTPPPRSRFRWLLPRRGRWRWALLRLAALAVVVFLFRFQVLAWLVAGHNWAWKSWTGSARNLPGDMDDLLYLRGPGVRMLVRLGEETRLVRVLDPAVIPALLDIAREHADPHVRACAFRGLARFHDERTLELAATALADGDDRVRLAAAHLFDELGDERHVPLLRAAAGAEASPGVRFALQAALASIAPAVSPPQTATERTVKVAAIQFVSQFGQPAVNRPRLEARIREAAAQGAKIVVLPETAIQGYMTFDIKTAWHLDGWPLSEGVRGASPKDVAETVPGPSTDAFAALAKELGIYLTVPVLETEPATGRFFNSLCLVGPDGRLLLHYRKLNPWPYAERGWASRGDRGHQAVDTPYGRLGLLICYDINYEPPQLAKLKVDTLLYAIAWVDRPHSPWFDVHLPRVARESRLNIVGANWTVPARPDWHGYGRTRVIARTGRILAQVNDDLAEETVYAELPVPAPPVP